MSSARSLRRRASGFTLLEVLAAVALLAILYTVLARVAIEETLFGPDGALTLPSLGRSEATDGDFTLVLEVAPFEPPAEWELDAPDAPKPVLFAPATGAGASAPLVRTIQLRVSWLEGAEERHVSRTLYAVDFAQVATLAEAVGTNGQASAPGSEELDDFERQIQQEAPPSEVEPP